MAENEANVISYLLNVEAEASDLVKEAQEEANRKLFSVRAKADAEFKEKFEKSVAELDKKYNEKINSITEEHKKTLEDYKTSVEQTEQDKTAFNDLLEKILLKD